MTSATQPRIRQVRRALHGVLLLDKPIGWTSNDALQKAKWLLRADKAGHTGTLDPLATGLLPLCFGAATKFSQVSLDADKRYLATLRLGQRTSTGDREGEVVEERPVQFDAARLDAVLAGFNGEIDQMPPMHSALKKDGKALYDYARAGIEIERQTRRVTIHRLEIVSWHDAELVIDVVCTKGTYIRSLAEEIGSGLGCGAHLSALRRTGSGTLDLAQATTLDELIGMTEPEREALLQSPDSLLADWPLLALNDEDAGRLLCGLRRRTDAANQPRLRVYGPEPGAFLGCAHIAAGELIPDRLLSPPEVAALCMQHATRHERLAA